MGLCHEHLANIIHSPGYCRMFLGLTSHRTWTLTRSHDLEALTDDTEKGREGWRVRKRETYVDILLTIKISLFFCTAE